MNNFAISILIPTHNRNEILRRTLSSLAAVTVPHGMDVEVVVIANGCTDRTEEVVAEMAGKMPFPTRCIPEPQLGLNVARNRAIKEASRESQVLAFLDDDVALDQGWLIALKEVFETTPADIVAGKLTLWWEAVARPDWMTPSMEGTLSRLDLGEQTLETNNEAQVVGADFAFRRTVVEKVGLFILGLDRVGSQVLSCGETEFVRRAKESGFRIFYAPKMHAKHWVAPHRATHEYVENVMRGLGQSMIFMRKRFGPVEVLKQILARLGLFCWFKILQWIAPITGGDQYQYRLYCSYNAGALGAVFMRLAGKSPIQGQQITRIDPYSDR